MRKLFQRFFPTLVLLLVIGALSCAAPPEPLTLIPTPAPGVVPVYRYNIVNTFPHDPGASTQGLVYENGILYESTGRYGQSSLRKTELKMGRVLQRYNLHTAYYGEGIAINGDRIVQLTWKEGTAFVYDKNNLGLLGELTYTGQGWGIAWDGTRLITSDGTATLRFRDPGSFSVTGSIDVHDRGVPVGKLNELEYIDGWILANVWETELIAIINPETGAVAAWIDAAGLSPYPDSQGDETLNGIAFDPEKRRLFVTGKQWDRLFEIELVK